MLLNAVLALVVIYGGVQLHSQYQAAKAREAALRKARISQAAAPPFYPLPNDAPVLALGYKDVALHYLFHPSRNPEIEKALPPPPPPPPPMPELPRYYGQMNFGDGPMTMLAEKAGMPQKGIKPGETIGQFKLVDVNTSEITFEWTFNGEVVRRSLSSMMDHGAVAAAAAQGPDARTASVASAPPSPAPPEVIKSAIGPGELTGLGTRTCDLRDSTPAGTVVNGFRKTEGRTPFGAFCVWDPVK
jgi:hypothetical protein